MGFETPDAILTPHQVSSAGAATLAILEALRAHPIAARQERLVRLIGSTYYRDGYCYAAHETLAGKIGCAKSTVQSDLDDLEARGLIQVTRRHGTSNITVLADGLIEALRLWRVGRRARCQRNRGIPRIATTFTVPLPPARAIIGTIESSVSVGPDAEEEEFFVSMPCSEQVLVSIGSFASDGVLDEDETFAPIAEENRFQVLLEEYTETPIGSGFYDDNRPKEAMPPKKRDPHLSITISSPNNDEIFFQEGPGGASIAALVTEGVTPQRAAGFASIFESERIKRNIDLGLHRSKDNPPGYLLYLIQHDVAAKQPPPRRDSRLQLRGQERSLHSRLGTAPPDTPKVQSVPMEHTASPETDHPSSLQRLEALTPEERASYTARATEEVRRRLLPIIGSFNPSSLATQAMIHSRILHELAGARETIPNTS